MVQTVLAPKPGFTPHLRTSPLTDPWEPIYSRRNEDGVAIGLWLFAAHCNSRGFVHGGLIAALADNAMGLSYVAFAPEASGAVTIGLQIDYAASAKIGQWLEVTPRILRAGRRVGFVDALVTADDILVARASATFMAIEKEA